MNSADGQKTRRFSIGPALSFVLGFFLLGAIGFLSALMDTRGFDKPDYASCLFFFLVFGSIGGLLGLATGPVMRWWRKPQSK